MSNKICSDCYSGCTKTVSDKCTKYTGVNVPILGIRTGDSISYVNAAVIGFLVSTLDGTGILYELGKENICDIVDKHLKKCKDISVRDITNALSAAICELDTIQKENSANLEALNASYDTGCIENIEGTEGTHVVLQETINLLCDTIQTLESLVLNLNTNYVKITDIGQLIDDYINSEDPTKGGMRTKMVPNTVVEYYGPLHHFDATGAGIGLWDQIYLCNGENTTPDKRGRVGIGTTVGMGGGNYPAATDPTLLGNPGYTIRQTNGTNTVILTVSQIPPHTHTGSIGPEGRHTHIVSGAVTRQNSDGDALSRDANISGGVNDITTSFNGEHTHPLTISPAGGGEAHSNIQPVLACHYIMYIPRP